MNAACSICSELFDSTKDVAAIPCGHTFHRNCLDEWTKIQKTCPQCRLQFTAEDVIPKLYFETSDKHAVVDTANLQNQIQSLQTTLLVKEKEITGLVIQRSKLEAELHSQRSEQSLLQSQQICEQKKQEAESATRQISDLQCRLRQHEFALADLQADLKHSEEAQNDTVRKKLTNLQASFNSLTRSYFASSEDDASFSETPDEVVTCNPS